jgi:hypothetical protein
LEKSKPLIGTDEADRLYNYYPMLFLLGETNRAIEAVRKPRPDLENDANRESWLFNRSILEYMRNPGLATADKMLQAAGRSKQNECWAHWFIGCVLLGRSDRDGARRHFEACVATHTFHHLMIPHACRVYVERMKQDPTWPRWIPVKKEERKP